MAKTVWVDWSILIGGDGSESPSSVAVSSDFLAVTGFTNSRRGFDGQQYNGGDSDVFVSALSLDGDMIWTVLVGSDRQEYARGVAIDSLFGDVYIAGEESTLEGNQAFVFKFSSSGSLEWKAGLSSHDNSISQSIFQAIAVDGGDVYAVGYGTNYDKVIPLFVKYDSNGEQVWFQSSAGSARLHSVSIGDSGDLYVSGTSTEDYNGQVNNASISDAFVSRYSNSGEHIWTRFVGQPDRAYGRNVLYADGNIYVAGDTLTGGAFVANYSLDGALNWKRIFTQLGGNETPRLSRAADGNGVYYADSGTLVLVSRDGELERIHSAYIDSVSSSSSQLIGAGSWDNDVYVASIKINLGSVDLGPPTLSRSGPFQENVVLSAPLVSGDPDGDAVDPLYTYQWYLNEKPISGETRETYSTSTASEKYISSLSGYNTYKVSVSYTDAQGFRRTIDSAPVDVSPWPLSLDSETVQLLYVAYYGRPADVDGLRFWKSKAAQSGFSYSPRSGDGLSELERPEYSRIVNDFGSGIESQMLYEGKSFEESVNAVYIYCFGRQAEVDPVTGMNYWVGKLERGEITLSQLSMEVALGAQAWDLSFLTNRIKSANLFTLGMDTPEEILGYSGDSDTGLARDWLLQFGLTSAAPGDVDSILSIITAAI